MTEAYTLLTGRQELPPRWIFGNLQSRMAYRTQKEVTSVVKELQAKDFPTDAIILDFYWFGDSILGHLGRLDWYKKSWPKPEKMIRNFRKKGIKTILITEPYLIDSVPNFKIASEKGILATDSLGNTYVNHQFYFGPGGLIDIFQPEARDWFWQFYDKQIKKGVAAWWGDLGEPESHPSDLYHVNGKADEVHNIYGHNWDKMMHEKYAQHYPNTRLFHLQRSGFAGSQRFSAFPWTGDVSRSWGGLRAQLPLLLTMGMSGLGYIHSDAGGFAQGVRDDELYVRWMQFAAFTPVLRPHGSGIPSEPIFWSEETQNIVRKYIKLRYELLPYTYTLAWLNATKGEPLMRPLFYYHPNDPQAVKATDCYYWGPHMIIAPVLEKGTSSRKVYLPEGKWFDFHGSKTYEGGKSYDIPVIINDMPIFVKAGSVIPMTKVVSSTDYYKSDNFKIKIYPSPSFGFTQYEDDGIDRLAALEGKGEQITCAGRWVDDLLVISLSIKGNWEGKPEKRQISIEMPYDKILDNITVSDNQTNESSGRKTTSITLNCTVKDGLLTIAFDWSNQDINIEIKNK
jgi:oligosaccharide 4-alpha-D-glucosyltransferase